MVTEIGGNNTERLHIHGIVWCDDLNEVEKHWQYGIIWKGKEKQYSRWHGELYTSHRSNHTSFGKVSPRNSKQGWQ